MISQVTSFTNSMDNAPQIAEYVVDIFEDKKGNLWFGFSGGLFRLNDSVIVNITQEGPWN